VLGPLERVARGVRFGVSSSVALSVDSSTGDVGVSVSNVRCGFSHPRDFDGTGADEDDEDDEEDDVEADEDANERLGIGAASGVLRPHRRGARNTSASAPRSPPLPFSLVTRAEGHEPAVVMHSSDPSFGAVANVHAAATRLPLAALLAARTGGLQVALLVRSPLGVVATLLPSLRAIE
jgi:hypothetical protein